MKKTLAVLLAALVCLGACAAESENYTRATADYFNTVSALRISGVSEKKFSEIWEKTNEILDGIEKSASLSKPDSDISRFNRLKFGEETAVSCTTAEMLSAAFYAYKKTDGLYNPCVYPLVDLWGFSYRFTSSSYKKQTPYDRDYVLGSLPPPDEKYIKAFLKLMDFSKIELNKKDGAYYLKKNIPPVTVDGVTYDAKLDLGGIAKGYACDKVMETLKQEGCVFGLFICGQSSIGFLKNTEKQSEYLLEIKKPFGADGGSPHYANAKIKDAMLSSSVPYSKGYKTRNASYYHIIDPNTGWPLSDDYKTHGKTALCSTAIGSNAALCDAFTTGICLMDKEKYSQFLKNNPSIKAIAVFENDENKTDKTRYEALTNIESINMLDNEYILECMY